MGKIAILTLCSSKRYEKNAKPGLDSKKAYCKKQGYDLIVEGGDNIIDKTRPLPWSKINLIKKHLKSYDWIFYSDADVIIKNYDIKLETLLTKYPKDKPIIFSKDSTGTPNTGNYFVKNTPKSVDILNLIYAQTDFIFHKWWENGALIHLLKDPKFKNEVFLEEDSRRFNALLFGKDKYQEGDFLIHYVGFINWPYPIIENEFGRIHDGIGKYIGPTTTKAQRDYIRNWRDRD